MNPRYNINLYTTVAFCTSTTRLDFYNIKKEWGVGWRALRCQGPVTTTLYWGPVFLNGAARTNKKIQFGANFRHTAALTLDSSAMLVWAAKLRHTVVMIGWNTAW